MTVEFLEIIEDPPKPRYEVFCYGYRVGELYWDAVGPQYWFQPDLRSGRDFTALDLKAIYSRMVALTLDNDGNPSYRFPSEQTED